MNHFKQILHVTLAVAVVALFSVNVASAHGIERVAEEVQEGGYLISLQTDPVYPVTGKSTHFDVLVKDEETSESTPHLMLSLELHQEGSLEIVTLSEAEEEESGHYGLSYIFPRRGSWEIHVMIDGQEIEQEFTVDVDDFGVSGLLRSGIILILALALISTARRDCRAKDECDQS